MKTRIITGAVALLIFIAVLLIGENFPWVIALTISLLSLIGSIEFLTAKKLHKELPVLVLTALFAFSMPLLALTQVWYLPIFLFTIFILMELVLFRLRVTVSDITFSYSGTMLIALSFSCLTVLSCTRGWHSFYAIISLVGCWCADTAAYFTGSFLGKRKLCPNISPKKTVEGAIGGGIGAVVGTILFGLLFDFVIYRNMDVNYLSLLFIGLFTSVFSVMGDLVFSAIKRDCSIKDYGSLLPGHGGVLDRFDSALFCVPFVFFISNTMGLISA